MIFLADIFYLYLIIKLSAIVAAHISYTIHISLYLLFHRYNGTILLVRRTEDEVVCTPTDTLAGNRGNMLLTKLLLRRYPHLFSDTAESSVLLTRFLSAEASDRGKFNIGRVLFKDIFNERYIMCVTTTQLYIIVIIFLYKSHRLVM